MPFTKGHTYYTHKNSVRTRFKKGRKAHNKGIGRRCQHNAFYWKCTPCQTEYKRNYVKKKKIENFAKYRNEINIGIRKKRQKNPEKYKAYDKVKYALRRGYIKRNPCSVCGYKKSHAHHNSGYEGENALNVVWLCSVHHEQAHRKSLYKTVGQT